MSGHTPGPWTLDTVRTTSGLCHKVGPFPWKDGKTNHACVYDDYRGCGDGTPELVANARLIAAAPDLFDSLSLLIEVEEGDLTGADFRREINSAKKAAKAAIAKATQP
ncbi:hypothetical protein IP90_00985 [Luteimonas cucumeris]|uniref:Uncharacterized protein n=1 Tax=Luteimonas cucumeris TaxID=985012 RepID=A0A562LBB7_9GAMM|nr:hypothetical protein [Luteimonas cucumeris]TWI04845.1 hypothetical protein IP90_00985 [Luteimonas cucumeris]